MNRSLWVSSASNATAPWVRWIPGFRPFWLRLSAQLRALGVDRYVHWLPGVRRHPEHADSLVVNRRVARWYALQLLHLLGFRREIEAGDTLVVQRRSTR